MRPEPLEKVEMGEESSGRAHRCSKSDSRWAGEPRRGGQYWFLAGLLSHVPAGWFGACCPVNPFSTCQTSVDAETVAEASEH